MRANGMMAGVLALAALCPGGMVQAQSVTDASMTIDVHLYKGPLSLHPEAQWGELAGYVRGADASLLQYIESVAGYIHAQYPDYKVLYNYGAGTGTITSSQFCGNTAPADRPDNIGAVQQMLAAQTARARLAEGRKSELNPYQAGGILDRLIYKYRADQIDAETNRRDGNKSAQESQFYLLRVLSDACELRWQTRALDMAMGRWTEEYKRAASDAGGAADKTKFQGLRVDLAHHLAETVRVGALMKVKAAYWSYNQIQVPSRDPSVRSFMVGFEILAAEFSRRLTAGAEGLRRQIKVVVGDGKAIAGVDARELPLSHQLRTVAPSAVINTIVWNDAAFLPLAGERARQDFPYDRLQQVRQIYDDDSWSKINTVYASGRGQFSIALIKDDIGNWNIKNFESDPTKLLQSYFDLAKGVVGQASGLVAKIASGGVSDALTTANAAAAVARLGNQFAYGGGDGGTGDRVAIHRQQLVGALEQLQRGAQAETEMARGDVEGRTGAVNQARDAYNVANCAPDQAELQWREEAVMTAAEAAVLRRKAAGLPAGSDRDALEGEATALDTASQTAGSCADLRLVWDEARAALMAAVSRHDAIPAQTARQVKFLLAVYGGQLQALSPQEAVPIPGR